MERGGGRMGLKGEEMRDSREENMFTHFPGLSHR